MLQRKPGVYMEKSDVQSGEISEMSPMKNKNGYAKLVTDI